MRYGRIASWRTRKWLEELRDDDLWFGICSDDPFAVSDPLAVEVASEVYRRPQALFTREGGLLRNARVLRWRGLPPGSRVAAVACWDAAYNGRPVLACVLPTPRDFPAGGTFTLPEGRFYVGFDVVD